MHNKKSVNFVCSSLRFSTTYATNKKAHGCRERFPFLCSIDEIVEISTIQRKAKTLYFILLFFLLIVILLVRVLLLIYQYIFMAMDLSTSSNAIWAFSMRYKTIARRSSSVRLIVEFLPLLRCI